MQIKCIMLLILFVIFSIQTFFLTLSAHFNNTTIILIVLFHLFCNVLQLAQFKMYQQS